MIFKGLGIDLITPFNKNGIDYESAESLIEFLISNGVNAFFPLSATGEAGTVTAAEREEFLRFVIQKTNKRVPVIVGTGNNSTAVTIENTLKAEELGADGAFIVTPYYNKCTQNGIYAHYRAICDITRLPVVAYNDPERTGVNILPQTMLKLCDIHGMTAIKEGSSNMEQIMETIRLTNGRMAVYGGDDALAAPVMMMGGAGVISAAGGVVPALYSELTRYCLARNYAAAAEIQLKLLPLINALLNEISPIPLKAALNLTGLKVGTVRLPLTPPEPSTVNRLKSCLLELGLLSD